MNSRVIKCFKVLVAFTIQWQVATYLTEAVQNDAISNQQSNSDSFRSSFVLTMTDKTLLGNSVKKMITKDVLSCNQACLRKTWCVSTNFHSGRHTCKLNNKAFSESKTQSLLLISMKSSVYSEIKRAISERTCENGGTQDEGLDTKSCNEPMSSYCQSNPCINGGTCVDMDKGYKCSCLAGYTGNNCQTDIDDCSPNPCNNQGTCIDKVNSYSCSCTVKFTGNNCELVKVVSSNLNAGDDDDDD